MGSLLAHASSEQALLDAWEDLRSAAQEDGPTSPEILDFESHAARRIHAISVQLRAGTWQPSPAHHVAIAKAAGGVRHLAVPPVEDRVVERAILNVLDPVIDPLLMPWTYGYRRGLGVDDAIRALIEARDSGYSWVLRADIQDCFAQIPRWPVIVRLREVCPDPELVEVVRSVIRRHVVGKDSPHATGGRGLHQGSPLAPLLANLYLDGFDREMASRGWQVIRFSDDFAVPARDRAAAERCVGDAIAAAQAVNLQLNLGKTHSVSFDEGVAFLGRMVTASTGAGMREGSHPLETTIYVEHPGALIRTRGDRLLVVHRDEVLARVNLRRVRQVVLIGRVGMSTPFLQKALRRGIGIVLTDDHGEFIGRFEPMERGTPGYRLDQAKAARSSSAALKIARGFVLGKLQNQRVMLLRLDRRMAEPILGPYIRRIDRSRVDAMGADQLAVLRGLEGAGARDYFAAFGDFLAPEWGWKGRVRRPPTDPVNAMLSFAYTLLTNEGVTAAEAAGLDPYVGFLHEAHVGRPSLALDLIEEFRPILVDSVVFSLLGRSQVTTSDFDLVPDGPCRMTRDARDALITAYERRMLRVVTYRDSGRRVSYRTAMHLQAKSLARCLAGDESYQPVMWK